MLRIKTTLILTVSLLVGAPPGHAACSRWSAPTTLIDAISIREASGIASSQAIPDRLYFTDDFQTGLYGGTLFWRNGSDTMQQTGLQRQRGYERPDMEALGYGPCSYGNGNCIFLGNIGSSNNQGTFYLVIVGEQDTYSKYTNVSKTVSFRYPSEARTRNSDAMAVHPNGDVYLMHKSRVDLRMNILRIRRVSWEQNRRVTPDFLGTLSLENIGMIDSKVMGFSISDDGAKFVLMTQADIVEVDLDLSQVTDLSLVEGTFPIAKVQFRKLGDQQAITYLPGSRSFAYTGESHNRVRAPLLRIDCLD